MAFPTATEGPFDGIVYGAPMTVTITYDPGQVPPAGLYAYKTRNGSNGNIVFAVGNLNLDAAMDNGGSDGWPIIQFNKAQFSGISYVYSFTLNGDSYRLRVNGLYWEVTNTATNQDVASGIIIAEPTS